MCTLTGHTDRVTTVSVTPDGRCAISASWDKSLKVWDLETGKEIHSLVGHTDAVRCASLTPDGRFAISVSNDNTVKAWDLDNGMSIARFVSDGSLYTCAVAPDGKTIIAGGALGSVHILRLEGTDAGAVRVTDDQSTLTPEHSGKSSRAYTRFVRRLSDVSQVLNVPYSAVTEWRDERKCPILEKAPYNIEALKNWLTQQANLQIDYSSELARRKLETEVRKLEGEGRVFSRDKSFWIAVAALGITVTREVREWLEGSNFAGPADKADKKAESLELQKAKAEHRKRLRRFSVAEHAGFHYPDVPASPAHASPGPFDRELSDLAKAVVLGETDRAVGLVHCLLDAGLTGQDILNQGVFAGMSVVGEKFKRHEILVPEVLLSARVMKVCFEKLKLETPSSSVQHVGKAVIGTVRGDLHDIGKSLVAVMMRGRGVKVIDLGTDVAADSFLQTLSEENAQLLCLSALLTKTVAGINEVIEILSGREDLDHVKVLIGGASVRPEHAEQYAADGYGEDATTGAELAVGLLRSQKPSVRVQRRQ
jgi:methanogenic corrinoid protein MtbC1